MPKLEPSMGKTENNGRTTNRHNYDLKRRKTYGENGRHDDSADILSSASKRLLRTLSLLTKHYIHLCKCAEQERTYSNLLKYIRETYNIEHRIASNKGTQHLLNKKWGLFSNMFDN